MPVVGEGPGGEPGPCGVWRGWWLGVGVVVLVVAVVGVEGCG